MPCRWYRHSRQPRRKFPLRYTLSSYNGSNRRRSILWQQPMPELQFPTGRILQNLRSCASNHEITLALVHGGWYNVNETQVGRQMWCFMTCTMLMTWGSRQMVKSTQPPFITPGSTCILIMIMQGSTFDSHMTRDSSIDSLPSDFKRGQPRGRGWKGRCGRSMRRRQERGGERVLQGEHRCSAQLVGEPDRVRERLLRRVNRIFLFKGIFQVKVLRI